MLRRFGSHQQRALAQRTQVFPNPAFIANRAAGLASISTDDQIFPDDCRSEPAAVDQIEFLPTLDALENPRLMLEPVAIAESKSPF